MCARPAFTQARGCYSISRLVGGAGLADCKQPRAQLVLCRRATVGAGFGNRRQTTALTITGLESKPAVRHVLTQCQSLFHVAPPFASTWRRPGVAVPSLGESGIDIPHRPLLPAFVSEF